MESCEKYRMLITQLAESGSQITDPSVLNHINNCESCRTVYEETKSLIGILKNVELREPPADFAQKISDESYSAFTSAKKQRQTVITRLRRLTIPATAAAVIFLAVFISTTINHNQSSNILSRAKTFSVTPEDVALATFTDETLFSEKNNKTTYLSETKESVESQSSSDIEWVETQLPEMIPSSSKTDLFYFVESLSAEEAESLYKSLGGTDS